MPDYNSDEAVANKKEDAIQGERIKSFRNKGLSERDAVIQGLVSMKRAGSGGDAPVAQNAPDEEAYPYGLKVRLENEDLQKLGITDLPTIGSTVKITATAKVDSVSSNESSSSEGPCQCVEFQITEMQVEPAEAAEAPLEEETPVEDTGEVEATEELK